MLTLIAAGLSVTISAGAEVPRTIRRGYLWGGARVSYVNTPANYDSNGNLISLYGSLDYQNTLGAADLAYDWTRNLRTFASLSYSNARSDNGLIDQANSGFNEGTIGAQGWFRADKVFLVPQMRGTFPFWHVDETSTSPLLGEGAVQFEGGAWTILKAGQFSPYAYAGYDYRDGGRSSLIVYSAGLNFSVEKWWADAAFGGGLSATSDSSSDFRVQRDFYLTNADGGSYQFYSINPSWGTAVLNTGFDFGDWRVFAGISTVVYGNSVASGWTFLGGLTFNTRIVDGPEDGHEQDPSHFHLRKEKYDESLFRENPNSAMPSASDRPPSDKDKVKRKTRKRPSVNRVLHETEKELNQPEKQR